jgi:hypothetical protein
VEYLVLAVTCFLYGYVIGYHVGSEGNRDEY